MAPDNETMLGYFTLLGLLDAPDSGQQAILFVVFGLLYLMTIAGNLIIVVITQLDSQLQKPMYFFLCNLSFMEICYTTSIVPNMLANFLRRQKTISFSGCFTQMFFFISLSSGEWVLLSAMAYDRFAAICHPLRYLIIMRKRVCFQLAMASWTIGFTNSLVHTALVANLPFCGTHTINHFFCHLPPLLKMSCRDTHLNDIVGFTVGGAVVVTPFLLIIISYICIISTILKINSAAGRRKTFSTCGSHLTVVSIYFGTVIFTYMRPSSRSFTVQDRVVTVFYSIVTPLINPVIYSFRNKEAHGALQRMMGQKICL